jgi:DNA-binding CsgD family transcriptional regulator
MLQADSTPSKADLQRAEFWPLFSQSRIPMALVDRHRLYVEVNDAVVDVYKVQREEVLRTRAGRTAVDDPATGDAQWDQLVRTNALYSERLISFGVQKKMRVSYAAHTTTVNDHWLALFVTLSARLEPEGSELIGTPLVASGNGPATRLTDREWEVVSLVALGSTTRRIATDLSLSPDTIRSHVRNAMAKTGAHTRAQLVALLLAGAADDASAERTMVRSSPLS